MFAHLEPHCRQGVQLDLARDVLDDEVGHNEQGGGVGRGRGRRWGLRGGRRATASGTRVSGSIATNHGGKLPSGAEDEQQGGEGLAEPWVIGEDPTPVVCVWGEGEGGIDKERKVQMFGTSTGM